ncbi:MAG TPA: hypothetical protein VFB21_19510 [Chthonomonadaceae bacterium]|nr:hypothetical protein [Chthonomonadaceae bacterium]
MKTQISPALGIGIIVAVIVLAGWFMYRNLSKQQVDTSASMSPELKRKIISAYGGGRPPSGQPPAQANR